MITGVLLTVALALLCWWLSGSRNTAYLLYFLAFIPFLSFDPTSGGLQDVSGLGGQNVIIKMGFRALTTVGFLALLLRRREVFSTALAPACLPVVAYFTWAMIGMYRAQSPWVSFFRLGELLAFFLAGVCLYLEVGRFRGPRELARWHCLALLPLCLITLYYAEVFPEQASHHGPGGLRLGHQFIEANVLGFAATAAQLWSVHELKEPREHLRSFFHEKLIPIAVLLVSTHVLVYARSRTAMITAVVGHLIIWFPYLGSSKQKRAAFGALCLAAVAMATVNIDTVLTWFLRGDSAADLATGTGRTGLWSSLLAYQVPNQPLFGAGYLMLGPRGPFEHAGHEWTNTHNTYVFALVATGVPGLVMVCWLAVHPLFCLFRRVHTAPPEERSSWAVLLAMSMVVFVTNITGFGVSGFPNAAMFFHYALYALAVLPRGADYKPARAEDRTLAFPERALALPPPGGRR